MSNKFQKPELTELDLLLLKNRKGELLVVRHIFATTQREELIFPTTRYVSDRVTDMKNKLKSHGLSIKDINLECDRKMSGQYKAYWDLYNEESFEVFVLRAQSDDLNVDGENAMFISLHKITSKGIEINGEALKFSPLTLSVAKVLVEEQVEVMTA